MVSTRPGQCHITKSFALLCREVRLQLSFFAQEKLQSKIMTTRVSEISANPVSGVFHITYMPATFADTGVNNCFSI